MIYKIMFQIFLPKTHLTYLLERKCSMIYSGELISPIPLP